MKRTTLGFLIASLMVVIGLTTFSNNMAHAVTMDFAYIGNAGNAGDVQSQGTFGAVAYNYAISKTEVTNTQYVEFLNGVAASDPYGLYSTSMGDYTPGGITRGGSPGSYSYAVKADAVGKGPGRADYTYADKPVIFVSWLDSVRYINWLHNGQGSGDTEMGAYTLSGGMAVPPNSRTVTHNTGAKYWLPTENEWYKAAYHDASAGIAGIYFDYPTGANTTPDNNLPAADTGNSANYRTPDQIYVHNSSYPLTDVGAYGLSPSPYGTFDQGGNTWEWNETSFFSWFRGTRGGSWGVTPDVLAASYRYTNFAPTDEASLIGFRVATVPEPSALLLLGVGLVGAVGLRKCHRSTKRSTKRSASRGGRGLR